MTIVMVCCHAYTSMHDSIICNCSKLPFCK